MSRSDKLLIEQHESTIAGLREQNAGLTGEVRGLLRGEARVSAQLAADISQSAVRAETYRQARDRAVGDVIRVLRLVAGHVLDEREAGRGDLIEPLVEDLALAGFSLRGHIVAVSAERADAAARADAQMSAAAIADAPVPYRPAS